MAAKYDRITAIEQDINDMSNCSYRTRYNRLIR